MTQRNLLRLRRQFECLCRRAHGKGLMRAASELDSISDGACRAVEIKAEAGARVKKAKMAGARCWAGLVLSWHHHGKDPSYSERRRLRNMGLFSVERSRIPLRLRLAKATKSPPRVPQGMKRGSCAPMGAKRDFPATVSGERDPTSHWV